MTVEQLKALDDLIGQGKRFAVYRLPGESHGRFLMQHSETPVLLEDVEALNGRRGFAIAPFDVSSTNPVVLIVADEEADLPHLDVPDHDGDSDVRQSKALISENDYEPLFSLFKGALDGKVFDKLVLSKSVTVERSAAFSPVQAFAKACASYPQSYVYLCNTPETGAWLGCTPEILLSTAGDRAHTVALAGTMPFREYSGDDEWNEKNREEQAVVVNYVREQLKAYGVDAEEKEPVAVQSGRLMHLKSDFFFSLPGKKNLGSLLKQLHPTPAVCGLPKKESLDFILRHEEHDRRYYSGFIGMIDPAVRSDVFVNLRCMQINQNSLTLYAGGGLLASSAMEEELQELNDKLQPMMALAQGGDYVFG